MTDDKQAPKDLASQWIKWQKDIWQGWMDAAQKGMEQAQAGMGPAGSGPMEVYRQWLETFGRAMSGGIPQEGLGPMTFLKAFDATRVYSEVMGFWAKAMGPLAQLRPGDQLSPEKIKQVYDHWSGEYQKMIKSLWGAMPSEEARETGKSFENAARAASEYGWTMIEPVLRNMEGWPALAERMAKGDAGAAAEAVGLFRKNYEATVGKALRAPSMGYFREFNELLNKTLDAYIEFNASMLEYATMFQNTSARASEKVFGRLLEFQGREITPDTPREFYRIWWTINEETFHELFLSPEFTSLLREVLRRGLLFRKWLDDLAGQIAEMANLPSKKDMDEIYKALYELKKEVRWQERAIRKLEEQTGVEVKRPAPHD